MYQNEILNTYDYILEIGSGIDKWDILQWYQDMHNLMIKKYTNDQCIW